MRLVERACRTPGSDAQRTFIKEKAAMTIPTYLPYYVLIGAIAIIAIILFGLRNALAKADWSKHDRATAFRFFAVILISWFLLALALGLAGAYKAAPNRLPTIQYGIFIPFLIGAWLIWRSRCGPAHRCCAAAVDRWRAALSSAGGDLSNPIRN